MYGANFHLRQGPFRRHRKGVGPRKEKTWNQEYIQNIKIDRCNYLWYYMSFVVVNLRNVLICLNIVKLLELSICLVFIMVDVSEAVFFMWW